MRVRKKATVPQREFFNYFQKEGRG